MRWYISEYKHMVWGWVILFFPNHLPTLLPICPTNINIYKFVDDNNKTVLH